MSALWRPPPSFGLLRTCSEAALNLRGLLRDVLPLLPAKNPIRPWIDRAFPLTEARLAHQRMEAGEHIGKIVLITAANLDR